MGSQGFDVAVVGLGVMGCAAAHALARAGKRVCALEQFDVGHTRGSSHGETRAIRLAYFEGPHYVDLLRAAYERWDALQAGAAETLFARTGMLEAGIPGSAVVGGVRRAAELNKLPLGGREALARFPQFQLPRDWDVAFEAEAGYLRPERILAAFARGAREGGADLRPGARVTGLETRAGSVTLRTTGGVVEAGSAIIAAGPWMTSDWVRELAPGLAPRLRLSRQTAVWFRPGDVERFRRLPVFGLEVEPDEIFYGFPDVGGGVKVSLHAHGARLATADAAVAEAGEADSEPLRRYLEQYLPGAVGPIVRQETCIYTNTVDGDFVIERAPDNVVLVSACSGHGFKFASILGPALAEMALGRDDLYTKHGLDRFALAARPAWG